MHTAETCMLSSTCQTYTSWVQGWTEDNHTAVHTLVCMKKKSNHSPNVYWSKRGSGWTKRPVMIRVLSNNWWHAKWDHRQIQLASSPLQGQQVSSRKHQRVLLQHPPWTGRREHTKKRHTHTQHMQMWIHKRLESKRTGANSLSPRKTLPSSTQHLHEK